MRHSFIRRGAIVAVLSAVLLVTAAPTNAQLFTHSATGSGTDGVGNRLTILAVDQFLLGGVGFAFVRQANRSGPSSIVILDCVIFDERPGPHFHFVYTSGFTLTGRDFYIGVFDDHGPGRSGPYDAIYVQTTTWPSGPCGVTAVGNYPVGWDPVASGDYVVN